MIIERVSVFPQCYAAVADRLGSFRREVLVVDIGSWTVDIMPISNQKPDIEQCVTLPKGRITSYNVCYTKLLRIFFFKLFLKLIIKSSL